MAPMPWRVLIGVDDDQIDVVFPDTAEQSKKFADGEVGDGCLVFGKIMTLGPQQGRLRRLGQRENVVLPDLDNT